MWRLVVLLLMAGYSYAQETCTLTGSGTLKNNGSGTSNWSCDGGSSTPVDMAFHAGNQVIIPKFLTLTIFNAQTWESNVTLEEENTPGSEDGGQIIFGAELSLGSSASCGLEFEMETGSNIDEQGGGNDRLTICETRILGNPSTVADWPSGGGGFYGPLVIDETGGSLPISLIFFAGQTSGNVIDLSWATSSEENFDYFEVEQSDNGYDFVKIGHVQNEGGKDRVAEYWYVVEAPFQGINYFRLKAIDLDGSFEYHPIISVDYQGDFERKLHVYPNPASDHFTLRPNFAFERARVSLKDLSGQSVFIEEQQYPAKKYSIPPQTANGLYLIEVHSAEGTFIENVLLTR